MTATTSWAFTRSNWSQGLYHEEGDYCPFDEECTGELETNDDNELTCNHCNEKVSP